MMTPVTFVVIFDVFNATARRLGDLERDFFVVNVVATLARLGRFLLLLVLDQWRVLVAVGRRVQEALVVVFRNLLKL